MNGLVKNNDRIKVGHIIKFKNEFYLIIKIILTTNIMKCNEIIIYSFKNKKICYLGSPWGESFGIKYEDRPNSLKKI
jgi:hypothetical protein